MPGPSTIEEFVAEYGDRGLLVLRAILEEYMSPKGRATLGDFSFHGIKKRIASYGIQYNPAPLLRILERNLGIIETTYKSNTQRWWKVTDIDAIKTVVKGEELVEDNTLKLIKIQFYSLEPYSVLEKLRKLGDKPSRLTSREKIWFREFVFDVLPRIVDFLETSEGYEDSLFTEVEIARSILQLAEKVALRIGGRYSELDSDALSRKLLKAFRNET